VKKLQTNKETEQNNKKMNQMHNKNFNLKGKSLFCMPSAETCLIV